ncbi:hypothetical protein GQ53DRAFT_421577 [Thozetella sp. PMI_491]|nr:hypothetical protein GQ53DRAFT_421577 [Thozetella sp. PMI_491]
MFCKCSPASPCAAGRGGSVETSMPLALRPHVSLRLAPSCSTTAQGSSHSLALSRLLAQPACFRTSGPPPTGGPKAPLGQAAGNEGLRASASACVPTYWDLQVLALEPARDSVTCFYDPSRLCDPRFETHHRIADAKLYRYSIHIIPGKSGAS